MPDATGLELLAQELRESIRPHAVGSGEAGDDGGSGAVVGTLHFRDKATLLVEPSRIREVLRFLRGKGFTFLASVHGVDYFPEEPRLGVHYELLDMREVDRITVKLRVPTDAPAVPSVVEDWPTADHQEREVYDMFGVLFDGHPDPRRILMPEDYEGYPQRRDFPIGGEPVLFTHSDATSPGWTDNRREEDPGR